MEHPALKRSWLQTGGSEISQVHRVLRGEFDQAAEAQYMGAGMFKLFNDAGGQIGLVQFQGERQASADDAMEAIIIQQATGTAPQPDPLAGDTIIRPLNLSDHGDAELAAKALSGKEPAYVVMDDIERMEVPPINLPDYQEPRRDLAEAAAKVFDDARALHASGVVFFDALGRPIDFGTEGMNTHHIDEPEDDGRGGAAIVGYLVMVVLTAILIAGGFGLYRFAQTL